MAADRRLLPQRMIQRRSHKTFSIMATGNHKRQHSTRRRRRRWPLDEALRREGLDETGYAQTFGGFFEQLEGKGSIPKLKLMLDGLKEWGRHLEGKRLGSISTDGGAPVVVQLVHNTARPSRARTQEPSEPEHLHSRTLNPQR